MNDAIFGPNMEFGDLILLIISIFVLVGGVLSILFILWGGILLILSGGKEEKIKPAINTIRYAVLGIIVTVVTIFVFPILGKLLGIDTDQYANPKRIFEKIEELGSKVFGSDAGSYELSDPNSVGEVDLPEGFTDLEL